MFLLKLLAGLIGLILTVAGGVGLVVGLPWLLITVLLQFSGEAGPNVNFLQPALCAGGGFFMAYLGHQLGRFARGDFD